MSRRASSAGFTLLELMIAIVLASLLSVLTYAGLQLGVRAWEASDRRLQDQEDRYLRRQFLRRLLESPTQRFLRGEDAVLQVGFEGQGQGVIFIARLPQIDSSPQDYWVQLTQQEVESRRGPKVWQLVMRYMTYDGFGNVDWELLEDQFNVSADQEVLIEELSEPLKFQYLEQESGREPTWRDDWLQRESLPLLIQVSSAEEDRLRLMAGARELTYAIKTVD